eukprot:m.109809 g.109809  ORF g.109809 m.109809 type:complete len:1528 (-) comp13382_c3_seq1:218-4801(-)
MSDEEVPFDDLEAAERGLLKVNPTGRQTRNRTSSSVVQREQAIASFKAGREALLESDDEDFDDIYEEVDEDEYQHRRRQLLETDSFVVDDGTGDYDGYYDDGRDGFDEDEFEATSKAGRRARANQQRKPGAPATRRRKPVQKRRVNSLFTGGKRSTRLGATVVKMGDSAAAQGEDSFLQEVMAEDGDFGAADGQEESGLSAMLAQRKNRRQQKSLQHAALFGSATDAHDMFDTAMDAGLDADLMDAHTSSTHPTVVDEDAMMDPELDAFSDTEAQPAAIASTTMPSRGSQPPTPKKAHRSPVKSPHKTVQTKLAPQVMPTTTEQETTKKKLVEEAVCFDSDDDDDDEDNDDDVGCLVSSKPLEEKPQAARATSASAAASQPHALANSAPVVSEAKLSGKLPYDEDDDGEKVLHFYWLDAYETTIGHKSGTVFLFGKVWVEEASSFVSCCLTVNNLERNVFVVPRERKVDEHGNDTAEEVDNAQVFEEVSDVLFKHGIPKFDTKPVTRNYAFECHDVPHEMEVLKIKYSASLPRLPNDMAGKTFSHIFGTNISPLERFLMKRDLMGPCWLKIKNAKQSMQPLSWCKLEAEIDNPKFVTKVASPPPSPPVTVLSLSLQTIINRKTNQAEIVAATGLVCTNTRIDGKTDEPSYTHFSAIRKLQDTPFPFDLNPLLKQKKRSISLLGSERALLSFFMAKLYKVDPDFIVGHNLFGYNLDVFAHRLKHHNIPNWSRMGRLKRTRFPFLQSHVGQNQNSLTRELCTGRLTCDVQVTSRELIRQVSYALTDLARTQLSETREEIEQDAIPRLYSKSHSLLKIVNHVERDALLVFQLMFKLDILPLMKQITNITGGLMSRTLTRGRSDRNEFLLCHEFHRRKFIVPDHPDLKKQKEEAAEKAAADGDGNAAAQPASGRRKPAYAGGLVLEPKRGFYDNYILLLDFNSLYPSIIQEYNICFTTVDRANLVDSEGHHQIAEVPDASLPQGILPKVLRKLIERRRQVKQLIKTETNKVKLAEYDIRQKALKLTANSMYGCLGFTFSRFYAKPLAELITSKGREILQKTVDLSQGSLGLDVIYGDTDSIMVDTKCRDLPQVKQIGYKVIKEVNALYKELEIDIDGVYKTMLLLKKKKYAALMVVEKGGVVRTEKEVKGLDIVRRDWSALAQSAGNFVLDKVLTQEQGEGEALVTECHEYLRKLAQDCRTEGAVPLEQFIIHKSLTKDPEKYPDSKSLPHVQVALRMRSAGKSVKQHDTVPYIICADGSSKAPTQRAYHPDSLKRDPTLKVDIDYYLKSQVHPVVSRLLEPIEGTDNGMIADCLGLDPSSFQKSYAMHDMDDTEEMTLTTELPDDERYKAVSDLMVTCRQCKTKEAYAGVVHKGEGKMLCGLICSNCGNAYSTAQLCNAITLQSRHFIRTYYEGQLVCSEQECPRHQQSTRQLSSRGTRCLAPNCNGKMSRTYTDSMLYTQLSYYMFLFDVQHAVDKADEIQRQTIRNCTTPHEKELHAVFKHARALFNKNARRFVNLRQLFDWVGVKVR